MSSSSSSSSSPWGKKLQSKLDALSNASSRESCQALAKWIGFNRKQLAAHFAPVLAAALRSEKQPVILNVVNETLLLEKDNPAKWDRLGDVRLSVGELVLLPTIPHLSAQSKDRVLGWLGADWEESGVFGERPTFGEQLRRALKSTTSATTAETGADAGDNPGEGGADADDVDDHIQAGKASSESTVPASAPAGDGGESHTTDKAPNAPESESSGPVATSSSVEPKRGASHKKAKGTDPTKASSPTPPATSSSGASPASAPAAAAAPFDFESRGIPPADVDPDELLRHSRQIATLQIGRDLRNDNAVQLSSLLSSLPAEVRALLDGEKQEDESDHATIALDDEAARDLSHKVNPALLDMDLDEQLQDVLHFRELVLKQQVERKKLVELLIASRCQFGAQCAAAAFSKADRSMDELVERRQVLLDAMELEGLDITTEEASAKDVTLDELPPLTWYRPEAAPTITEDEEHDAKRQKVRCVARIARVHTPTFGKQRKSFHPSDESQCFNTIHACQLSPCGLDLINWKASEECETRLPSL
jgi:hypothetical protein